MLPDGKELRKLDSLNPPNLSVSTERMVIRMMNSNNIDFSEITPQIHELAQRRS